MMTHFHRSKVDGEVLAAAARGDGCVGRDRGRGDRDRDGAPLLRGLRRRTARSRRCSCCASRRRRRAANMSTAALEIEVVMVDFDGEEVVARA